jgi:hypothetical protein
MMVLGENRQWEAKKLTNTDLKGKINVYLDEASVAPKSKAYQQLVTGQLLQTGLVNVQDPGVRLKILQLFDAPDLVEDLDIDIKDAAKEKEEFTQTGRVRPRLGIDNDSVHASEHRKVAKSDSFKLWPPQHQQVWIQHTAYHTQQVQQQAKQQQQNDPKFQIAELKKQEIMAELQALLAEKGIELKAAAQRRSVDLNAHLGKKRIDVEAHAAMKGAEAAASAVGSRIRPGGSNFEGV